MCYCCQHIRAVSTISLKDARHTLVTFSLKMLMLIQHLSYDKCCSIFTSKNIIWNSLFGFPNRCVVRMTINRNDIWHKHTIKCRSNKSVIIGRQLHQQSIPVLCNDSLECSTSKVRTMLIFFNTRLYIYRKKVNGYALCIWTSPYVKWVFLNKHIIFSFPNLVHIKVNSELSEGTAHWKEWVKQY